MSEPFDEGTEERLRAILRAEADSVEPSPEALNAIRERTQSRRSPLWSGLPWLRPVVAVGAAAAIAGSVLMGTPQLRDQIFFAANEADRPSQEQERPEDDGAGEATDFTGHGGGRAEQEDGGGRDGGGAASPTEEDEEQRTQDLPAHCRTPVPPDSESPVATATGRSEQDQDDGEGQERPPECDPDKQPDEGDGDGSGGDGDGGTGGDSGSGDDGGGSDGGSGGDGSGGEIGRAHV